MSIAAMNWAWEQRLKPNAKLVLMAIADNADEFGFCWPGITYLARKTCMGERSVQRVLRSLKEGNLITIQARFRPDGSHTTNGYRLALTKPSGVNLSPPSSQPEHEVVSATSSPDGVADTQTTIEPSFNHKQPQQDSKNATTTKCIYPNQLNTKECSLASQMLSNIDTNRAQELLDELAARLNAKAIKSSPIGYLRSLIAHHHNGTFVPELGIKVETARIKAVEKSNQKPVPFNPTKPEDIPKKLASMRNAIGKKTNPNKQEKASHG